LGGCYFIEDSDSENHTARVHQHGNGAEMIIRTAQLNDARQISILSNQFGWKASEDDVKGRLEIILGRVDHKIFVCESDDGEALGWIHVGVNIIVSSGRYGEVLAFVVDEEARGAGIGRALLARGEEWIKDHECDATSIVIRCNNERKRTHDFYTRNGYDITMIGLRKMIVR
jgi:GNAT superfamily N-acetyltransferase